MRSWLHGLFRRDGSPVSEVCQKIPSGSIAFVAVHPAGKAGGVTPSNDCERIGTGSHCDGVPCGIPATLNTEEPVAASATTAAAPTAKVVARMIKPSNPFLLHRSQFAGKHGKLASVALTWRKAHQRANGEQPMS